MSDMMIGELAQRTGIPVRTLRFYADEGVLPEQARTDAGYRVWGPDAVARARLARTLRDLGVGLDDVKRVLRKEMSLADVAAVHALALDAQIETLRLQRAVLRVVAHTTEPQELERMTDLTRMTADERRWILGNYLDAVFGDHDGPVAERLRLGAPELPDDPTADQIAAWVELAGLLRDPEYIALSRRMAERAREEDLQPDPSQFDVGTAIGENAGGALRDGIRPESAEGLAIIQRLEAMAGITQDRAAAAERIEAFTDRRVARYWTLVAIVNDWPAQQAPAAEDLADAWEWYAQALRAHA